MDENILLLKNGNTFYYECKHLLQNELLFLKRASRIFTNSYIIFASPYV